MAIKISRMSAWAVWFNAIVVAAPGYRQVETLKLNLSNRSSAWSCGDSEVETKAKRLVVQRYCGRR